MAKVRAYNTKDPEILGIPKYVPLTGCTINPMSRDCDLGGFAAKCKTCGWSVEVIDSRKERIEAGAMITGLDGLKRLIV